MEERYILSFNLAPGIGPKGFQKLLRSFGSAKKAWFGTQEEFKKAGIGEAAFGKFEAFRKLFEVDKYLIKLEKAKVNFVPYGDKYYPKELEKISAPPIGLFIKGNKNLLTKMPRIGVVGTRKVTSYGRQVTESLVSDLVRNNFVIVSGMALGVDAWAHRAALDNEGKTIAVLGCGVDCPMPRENDRLYEEILDKNGLIISEYWLGTRASRGTFPARNRIIAGISQGVIITEAGEDSGSLITADRAFEQGKPVFSVPGMITSAQSRGSLSLLKHGAILVQSISDVLESFGTENKISEKKHISHLSNEEKIIFETLQNESMTIDELAKFTKIPISKLSILLSGLEISGVIRNLNGKFSL